MLNNGWNSYIGLSKNTNRKINFFSDDVFYSKGKVLDVSIYSNIDDSDEESDLVKSDFFQSIKPYMNKNKSDIKHFLNLVEPYVNKYKKDKIKFGPNLQYYYNKFRKIDKENVLTLNEKKFNGLLVKITIEREVMADIGCKLSNTHGR